MIHNFYFYGIILIFSYFYGVKSEFVSRQNLGNFLLNPFPKEFSAQNYPGERYFHLTLFDENYIYGNSSIVYIIGGSNYKSDVWGVRSILVNDSSLSVAFESKCFLYGTVIRLFN